MFVVAWAGMRGVVSLAAAFGVADDDAVGRRRSRAAPQLVFLTFVVVVGTLLLHGLTLPWLIRGLGVQGDEAARDAMDEAAAQDKGGPGGGRPARRAAGRGARADRRAPASRATMLRGWNTRRRNAAWERLGRGDEEIGESPAAAFRRLRLEMLAAERETFIAERDAGHDRRRGAAGGAARARPRGGDAQPRLSVELAAECPHGIDHRGERAVGGREILVGQVGERTRGCAPPAA